MSWACTTTHSGRSYMVVKSANFSYLLFGIPLFGLAKLFGILHTAVHSESPQSCKQIRTED